MVCLCAQVCGRAKKRISTFGLARLALKEGVLTCPPARSVRSSIRFGWYAVEGTELLTFPLLSSPTLPYPSPTLPVSRPPTNRTPRPPHSYNRRFVNITAQIGAGGKRRMNRTFISFDPQAPPVPFADIFRSRHSQPRGQVWIIDGHWSLFGGSGESSGTSMQTLEFLRYCEGVWESWERCSGKSEGRVGCGEHLPSRRWARLLVLHSETGLRDFSSMLHGLSAVLLLYCAALGTLI